MPVHVYAVTEAGHPLAVSGTTGIGHPPAPLRTVRSGGVAAVVSDASEAPRAKRRDLMAHQRTLELVQRDGALLPMRFGLLAEDDAAVERVLAERQDEFLARLREIGDRVEFNVRAVQDEETGVRAALTGNERVRRLSAATRDGGSYEDRLALGEAIAADLEERRRDLAERVAGGLRPLARAEAPGAPAGDAFLNVSFLVDRGRTAEFTAAADRLAGELGGQAQLRLHGPLPPYSFVAVGEEREPETASWAS